MDRKFRNICFTLNNYTEEDYRNLLNHEKFKYIIIGKEIGEGGTPHHQGHAELTVQMRFNRVKREIHDQIHFERRYGTQKQAIEYCKKDNTYEENGEKNRQGERTDLMKLRDLIQSGSTQRDLLSEFEISSGQLRVVDRYYTYLEPNKRDKPTVTWIYSSTGSGRPDMWIKRTKIYSGKTVQNGGMDMIDMTQSY